jgi:cell division protein FtsB
MVSTRSRSTRLEMPPVAAPPQPTNLPRGRNTRATSTDPQGQIASLEKQMQQMSKNMETLVAQNERIHLQILETTEEKICL